MINTKLILVEGISGSGKSSTAHYLSRQLDKNNIKNRWFHEEEKEHPLFYDRKKPMEPGIDRTEYFIENYPQQWANFAKQIEEYDGVCIIESFLTQFSLIPLIMKSYSEEKIQNFIKQLYLQIEPLNPVIVFNYYNDVKFGLDLNLSRRGKEWENWYLNHVASTPFAKENNLDGYNAALSVMQKLSDNSKEFMNTIPDQVIDIDISSQYWEEFHQRLSDHLSYQRYSENHPVEDYQKYCGIFKHIPSLPSPEEMEEKGIKSEDIPAEILNTVHICNNRLCLDAFWPNLKLIALDDNLFSIEAFHFLVKFNLDDEKVLSFDFIENNPKPFLSSEEHTEEECYRFNKV